MPEPCGGWLAADGRYWPCRDLEHATTAIEIVRMLRLAPRGDAMAHLEDLGWMHVFDNGGVMGCSSLTQAQMDTLMDLACTHPVMRRWVMISLDVETSENDVDVVLRHHGVSLEALGVSNWGWSPQPMGPSARDGAKGCDSRRVGTGNQRE